jgi:hypothetical protein
VALTFVSAPISIAQPKRNSPPLSRSLRDRSRRVPLSLLARHHGHNAQTNQQYRTWERIWGANELVHNLPEYPPADLKTVVRPNFDTLYSSGWLDLTKEPVIVSVPDTDGRYYLLPMLDMWTDVFASPGWRKTGTAAGNFIVVPPGWRPDLRDRLIEEFKLPKDTQRIDAPTPYVWIIGRTKTGGPQDYDAVHKIDMKTPPKIQVDTMPAASSSPTQQNS